MTEHESSSSTVSDEALATIDLSKFSDVNLPYRAARNNRPISEHVREQVRAGYARGGVIPAGDVGAPGAPAQQQNAAAPQGQPMRLRNGRVVFAQADGSFLDEHGRAILRR